MTIDILEGLRLFAAGKRLKMRNPQKKTFPNNFLRKLLEKI